jgi:hypothetical protein
MHPYHTVGAVTPNKVAWLSSIKVKDLNGCGKLTLDGDMNGLSNIDLSNMDTLEGTAVL